MKHELKMWGRALLMLAIGALAAVGFMAILAGTYLAVDAAYKAGSFWALGIISGIATVAIARLLMEPAK